ncbi:hypothetical protein GCM10007276_33070 [Agaricicola taiwanensis]|uniref:Uncharacterized protein n=1 Tax=Agaricicola taiwanensis TaxID=591372 RepID=A0A8J2YMX4_9RHOB|nr:hypothetical protein [Agaricicola taiwanensis]GGE53426.1 hypothetical protein GCM10007276_33070 [Agaricicola taiwanensis]
MRITTNGPSVEMPDRDELEFIDRTQQKASVFTYDPDLFEENIPGWGLEDPYRKKPSGDEPGTEGEPDPTIQSRRTSETEGEGPPDLTGTEGVDGDSEGVGDGPGETDSDAQARVDAAAARMEQLMAWAMEVNVQFAEAQVPYKTGSTIAQSTRA